MCPGECKDRMGDAFDRFGRVPIVRRTRVASSDDPAFRGRSRAPFWAAGGLVHDTRGAIVLEKKLQPMLRDLWKEGRKSLSTKELLWEFGRRTESRDSLLWWAWKNRIPVYVPAIFDGAVDTNCGPSGRITRASRSTSSATKGNSQTWCSVRKNRVL